MKHKIGDVVEMHGEMVIVAEGSCPCCHFKGQCKDGFTCYTGDYQTYKLALQDWYPREWAIRQLLDGKTVEDDVGVVIEYRKSHHKPFYYEGEYNEAIEMDCGYRLHQPKKKVKKWMWVYFDLVNQNWCFDGPYGEEFNKNHHGLFSNIQKIEGSMREVEE